MKKLTALLLMVVMALSMGLMTACSNDVTDSQSQSHEEVKTPVGIEYLSGLADAYAKNSEISLSNLKINLIYDDGTTAAIAYNNEDFEVTADLSKVVEKTDVVIKYKEFTCTKTIAVTDEYKISSVTMPSFILDYNANKNVDSKDPNGFKDQTQSYVVGDDNQFAFRPTVKAIDIASKVIINDLKGIEFVIELAKWQEDKFVEVENTDDHAVIDTKNCAVDFAEVAVGGKYQIKFYPAEGLSDEQLTNPNFVKTIEVEVVDGYNAYTFEEMSLIDNTASGKHERATGKEWQAIRDKAGIKADPNTINGIVFHGNIAFDPAKIPGSLLIKEGDSELNEGQSDYEDAKNSLRDNKDIFLHDFEAGEKFTVYGNYFNIDCTKLPFIVRNDANKPLNEGETIVSHTTFFKFRTLKPSAKEANEREEVLMKNISFTGNLNRKETDKTGGCIFSKINRTAGNLYNVNARQWYITTFAELNYDYNPVVVEKNKYFDNYNTILYNWGGHMEIKDSVLKGAGGPVSISDNCSYHIEDDPKGIGHVPFLSFDDKCEVESYVSGKEGWFNQMGATTAAEQVLALNQLFNLQGKKSYTKVENGIPMFNFVGLLKSGYAESMTFERIRGKISVGSHVMDMANPLEEDILYKSPFAGKTMFFQTTGQLAVLYTQKADKSDMGIYDVQKLINKLTPPIESAPGMTEFATPDHDVFGNDNYLNLFVAMPEFAQGGYMGIVLGGYHSVN